MDTQLWRWNAAETRSMYVKNLASSEKAVISQVVYSAERGICSPHHINDIISEVESL